MLQKGYPTFEPAGWGKCEEWHPYVPDMCTRAALEYDTTTGYKSSGFDISIAGKITPKWLVNAGFAKLKIGKPYDAPNSDSDLGDELNMDYGETYTAPAKTFKFFTRYDFTPKFSAGIGIRWNSGVRPKPWGHGYSGGEYYVSNKPKELCSPLMPCGMRWHPTNSAKTPLWPSTSAIFSTNAITPMLGAIFTANRATSPWP